MNLTHFKAHFFFAAFMMLFMEFFVLRVFGADSITENFQNATISPLLQNTSGYVFGPNASPVGTAQQTTAGVRSYISTVATDYNNVDFIFDLTITINGFVSQGPANCVFMGIGPGQPDYAYYTEPLTAAYLRADQTDFGGGVLYFEITYGQIQAIQVNPETAPGDGTHLLQIKKVGNNITFSCAENYTGGPFIPSQSITRNLPQDLSFLNSSNCRLFFGEDPLARIDNLQITVFSQNPVILTQPTNEIAQLGASATFSIEVAGNPLNYQWQFNNSPLTGATNASLSVTNISLANAGNYSVVVRNSYGSVNSSAASLAVLADGANGNNPNQMPVSAAPTQPAGVNNLVLITHGWEFLGPAADVSWITDMANAIQAKAPNWSVMPYNWMGAAWFPDPDLTLVSGAALGTLYAKLRLEPQHWQHIHFIAHSAGSAVIEAMAKELRSSPNPPLTIEETFLDPYTGFTSLTGRGVYGANADWADNYSALGSFVDFAPSIIGLGNATVGKLDNAYNTDVGWVDPNHWTVPYGSGQIALASHEWPHNFYMESITNTDPGWTAHGYGFPLSMEGGGGNNNSVNYPEGLDPFAIGGPLNALQSPFQQQSFTQLVLDGLAHAVSDVGAGLVGSAGFVLNNISSVLPLVKSGGIHPLGGPVPQGGSSSTPAWLAVGVTITNPVNLVQFDAGFTDTNAAEGLLTVYWNTNQIGLVDERAASTNLQTYRFALPSTVTSGIYTLSFRLDSFDSISSSIAVTNVATGFVGVTQPITLGISFTNGVPLVQLTAATNFTYLVQCSTNLVDWTPTALLVNANGTILFPDATATNSGTRFYRAIMP